MSHRSQLCSCEYLLSGVRASPTVTRHMLSSVDYEIWCGISYRAKNRVCKGCIEVVQLYSKVCLLLFLKDLGNREIIEMDKWCWGFTDLISGWRREG